MTGLSVGADGYVVEPFGPREPVARVMAMLRPPAQRRKPEADGPAGSGERAASVRIGAVSAYSEP